MARRLSEQLSLAAAATIVFRKRARTRQAELYDSYSSAPSLLCLLVSYRR
jgi:hypothetical protein